MKKLVKLGKMLSAEEQKKITGGPVDPDEGRCSTIGCGANGEDEGCSGLGHGCSCKGSGTSWTCKTGR